MKLRSQRFLIRVVGLLLVVTAFGNAIGQQLAVKPPPRPFEPGEELTYKAEISRALLKKLDVATFKFSTDRATASTSRDSPIQSPPANVLKFTGDVSSDGFFTNLFNVHFHQHIESTVDPESLTVQKTVKLDEQGKRVRASEANFDQKNGKVVWIERDPNDPTRPQRTVSADFSGQVQDVVSAIYYLRTQSLDLGKAFAVTISDSGRVLQIPVHVVEKKHMKTVLGRVAVLRVEPQLFGEDGLVKAKGQFSVWLTDDYRHIPVSAQLKSEFGTFDITLKKLSHQLSQLSFAKE
jgi:hypothetical protein